MANSKTVLIGIALAVALLAAGCGGDGGGGTETRRPEIVATYPEDGATDLRLNPLVRVWFDQELDEATVDSAALHVTGGVTERLEYDPSEKVVSLYLRELLTPDTGYEIFVDSTITNGAGEPMAHDKVFTFTTGPMDCDHLEDYLEPNDVIGSAAEIELAKAYPLLSSCGEGSPEYYKFVLADTVQVTVHIEHVYSDDPQPGWHFRFKRGEGYDYTWLITWFAAGRDLSHKFTFLPGTYYLDTGSGEAEDRVVVYNMILQLSAPCLDDSLEDNDFIDEASPIGPGLTQGLRGCYRDRDCYVLHLDAGQMLTVTVDQSPNIGAQLDLAILGPDGEVLTDGSYLETPVVMTWTATQDTSHYISATYWKDNVHYSIEVDVGPSLRGA